MASNFKRANAAVNEECTRVGALLNSGKLNIYSGTQPATADTDKTGAEILLAELTFGATAVGSPTAGVVSFNAIAPDTSANATGDATWFRAFKSDGTTPVFDGTVAATGGTADCIINSIGISSGAAVSCESMTYTAVKS